MYELLLLPMNKTTRSLTLSALLTALTVITLYIASVLPSGRMAMVALSSIFVAAAIIESGIRAGIFVYAASALLGLLILPYIGFSLMYILLFGYYPVVKSLIERKAPMVLQWILKLCIFNAALTVAWFFLRELIFAFGEDPPGVVLLYIGGSVVFVVFDYGFTKVIWLYINRISKYMKKGK